MRDLKIQEKLKLLQELYDSAEWLRKKIFFCRKGCSTCCTQSVTMSALEGELIYRHLESKAALQKFAALLAGSDHKPLRPEMTTNHFVRSFMASPEEIPVAGDGWSFEPCPFLENGSCRIYAVRPFACRAFVSLDDCRLAGTASVPPVLVTLNTLMQQIIEHLSIGGCWGNMLDVLARRLLPTQVAGQEGLRREAVLLDSETIPAFLVAEKERPVVQKYLDGIGQVLQRFATGEIQQEVKALQKCLSRI